MQRNLHESFDGGSCSLKLCNYFVSDYDIHAVRNRELFLAFSDSFCDILSGS